MNENFFERMKKNPLPVVVDFWAPWCSPCRMIEPAMKKLGADYAGRVEIWKENADEQPEVLRSLHISGIPTLIAFKNGQEVARRTGVASAAALAVLFDAALSGEKPARSGPLPLERSLRLVIGAALLLLAYQGHFSGFYLLLAGTGAVIAFSAVYDLCPIYKAVSARLKAWLGKESTKQPRT
jgi:thioredoxin